MNREQVERLLQQYGLIRLTWIIIACRLFKSHTYIISQLVDKKRRCITYQRECEVCDKHQRLEKPKKYDPVAYVWTDIKNEPVRAEP